MRKKLTPAFVRDVGTADTNQVYWDTEQRGFGLLVLPSGEKRYVIQYRTSGRSRRRRTTKKEVYAASPSP
jgi:hypothetical protein